MIFIFNNLAIQRLVQSLDYSIMNYSINWLITEIGSSFTSHCNVKYVFQDQFGLITYKIIGDDSAPTYFGINPQTGDIKLTASVLTDTIVTYQVSRPTIDISFPVIKQGTGSGKY